MESKELNILVLGETGVGKSTWINALANYFTYSTLNEAISSDPVFVIPSQYTKYFEDDDEERIIHVGEKIDIEEDCTPGRSVTRRPQSCSFKNDDAKIRMCFIDTPGSGDTRGREMDKINFENIMSHSSNLTELHGICILLKPNQARLTEYFNFCFQELLWHLHRDACKNIVFVFTNARGTHFKSGDTVPLIKKLIKENALEEELKVEKDTLYFLDNEIVRYLAEKKAGILHTEDEHNANESNWEQSSAECIRLMTYFSRIQPHDVKKTVSLNNISRLIVCLVKPLVDVAENMQENIDKLKEKQVVFEKMNMLKQSLSKNEAKISKFFVESKGYSTPALVCTSPSCTESIKTDDGIITYYKQICQDKFTVNGLAHLKNKEQMIRTCKVFANGICTKCHCSIESHERFTYDLIKKSIDLVSDEIKNEFINIKKIIEEIEKYLKELEGEQDILLVTSAKCGSFLENNSLIIKNDVIEHCLKESIDKYKQLNGGKSNVWLEKVLSSYNLRKKRYKEKGTKQTTLDMYDDILTLFDLPIHGSTLRQMYECVDHADSEIKNNEVSYDLKGEFSAFVKRIFIT